MGWGLLERGGLIKNSLIDKDRITLHVCLEFEMFHIFNNDYMCKLLHYNIQSC